MYVYMYVSMYVCVRMCVCMCVCMYANMNVKRYLSIKDACMFGALHA